jgi:hypothetical protein
MRGRIPRYLLPEAACVWTAGRGKQGAAAAVPQVSRERTRAWLGAARAARAARGAGRLGGGHCWPNEGSSATAAARQMCIDSDPAGGPEWSGMKWSGPSGPDAWSGPAFPRGKPLMRATIAPAAPLSPSSPPPAKGRGCMRQPAGCPQLRPRPTAPPVLTPVLKIKRRKKRRTSTWVERRAAMVGGAGLWWLWRPDFARLSLHPTSLGPARLAASRAYVPPPAGW